MKKDVKLYFNRWYMAISAQGTIKIIQKETNSLFFKIILDCYMSLVFNMDTSFSRYYLSINIICTFLRNGANETGLYIGASILFDMIKKEQQVDVVQVVKQIRKTRPQFIISQVIKKDKITFRIMYYMISWIEILSQMWSGIVISVYQTNPSVF